MTLKYANQTEINLCINILKMARDKIPKESYAYAQVNRAVNHVVFELEELK